jgi:hypothetical protein
MRKSLYKNIAALATGLVLLSGCDNYLEENPDNRVELNTPEKAAQLLTNAYSSAGYTFTEWMGDNVTFTTGTTKLTEHVQLYQWEDVTSINQDTPANFWTSTYDAIAHANEVLAVIDQLPGDQARKDAVKGEALLTRAYGHFMLVNLFGKHFNEETADEDLGIPYVEEPETEFIKKYDRLSVEEVYDKIEDDLLDGLELVDESFYANSGKYHFSRNGALAFASRFYLYKADYTNCVKYSSEMLGADPDVFLKDIQTLLSESANPEDFIRSFADPTDQSNLLVVRNVTNFPVSVGFWPDQTLLRRIYNNNPWSTDDVRTSLNYPIFIRGNNGLALAKYQFLFERTSLTSNVGLYYTIMPAFRGEEVLLNRAECYVFQNRVSQALADLQVLVNKRYSGNRVINTQTLRNYYQTTNDRLNIFYFILDERQKEFMHEGLRWFDIKRFQIEVTHPLADGSTISLDADDDRQVLQIPQAAIDIGGLKPNPR